MKLKLISDPEHGTRVTNAETGEKLEGVRCVSFLHSLERPPQLVIVIDSPEVEVVGEGDVRKKETVPA